MVVCSPEVDDENLPLESETRDGCDIGPSVREVRFGDGYSQRAPAGLNADLKTYSVTLSVSREEATALESFLAEHGGWKAFLWTPPLWLQADKGDLRKMVVAGQYAAC